MNNAFVVAGNPDPHTEAQALRRTEIEFLLRRMEDIMEPGDEIRVQRSGAGFEVYLSRPVKVQRKP